MTRTRTTDPMDLDQHQALGAQLHGMYKALHDLQLDLSRRYGKNAKPVRQAERAVKVLVALRSDLDDQLHADHRDDFSPEVYYPNTKGV